MKIEAITASLPRDLHILKLAVEGLRQFGNVSSISVATSGKHFRKFRDFLGSDIVLVEEDSLVPGMRIAELRELPQPGIAKAAGWHFQQLVKFAFGLTGDPDSDYLIWDADTVLLRPIDWYDAQGRTWFTMADEHHVPYFESYRRLLGHDPRREFSFISQHIMVNRASWGDAFRHREKRARRGKLAWKIMRGLQLGSFSEYEFYGHYVKNMHPERAAYRRLSWTRDGALMSYRPKPKHFRALAEKYDFAAFEAKRAPLTRALGYGRRLLTGEGGPLLPSVFRRDKVRP